MSSYKFKRRSFLRACGGSAALLAPLLRSIEASAQGMKAPLLPMVTNSDRWWQVPTKTLADIRLRTRLRRD